MLEKTAADEELDDPDAAREAQSKFISLLASQKEDARLRKVPKKPSKPKKEQEPSFRAIGNAAAHFLPSPWKENYFKKPIRVDALLNDLNNAKKLEMKAATTSTQRKKVNKKFNPSITALTYLSNAGIHVLSNGATAQTMTKELQSL